MLIETAEGVLNTNHIISAQMTPRASGSRSTILFADGTERSIGVSLEQLEEACGVIVPAQPGFTLIRAIMPSSTETGIVYSEDVVVAFRIGHGSAYDGPMPVTAAGEPGTLGRIRWTIRQPNGRCFGPDAEHDDITEFKADCEHAVASRLTVVA